MNKFEQLKEEVFKRFEKYGVTREQVDESVWEGDPYGWSRNAFATISTEMGIPNIDEVFDDWMEINGPLGKIGLFAEAINGGVTAVYED